MSQLPTAEEMAEWESWVRENMSTSEVISYHSPTREGRGSCYGCLKLWLRHVPAPCRIRVAAEKKLAREKSERAAAHLRRLHHG